MYYFIKFDESLIENDVDGEIFMKLLTDGKF